MRELNLSKEVKDEAFYAKGKQTKQKETSTKRKGSCYYCKKPGNWARVCRNKKKANSNSESLVAQQTKDQDFQKGSGSAAEFFNAETSLAQVNEDIWFADSGATEHMSFRKEWFKNLKGFSNNEYSVLVEDGNSLCVKGKGDIEVEVQNDCGNLTKHKIGDILYVPHIKKNLLSIGRSSEKGMEIIFKEGGQNVSFYKNNRLIVDATRHNKRLYRMNFKPVGVAETHFVETKTFVKWNERLGHVNFKTFLLLTDYFSRYCFVYFLKEKNEVLKCLKEFYSDVQADGHYVKRLRTDFGMEFCIAPAKEFLLSKGIEHETTTPRAPKQNGFIER
ncbi:uncharacterized protein LOC117169759 [Belonocnema kinseyi]|uniref:uncharacterized protein LOC117169759 n=1 Tax=Belonocnema kinseyi TaxID=2817044 RepID=UPI00143CE7BF|nr:uncharacterized protein LOC117169759 [Belonocnema kinseyi]